MFYRKSDTDRLIGGHNLCYWCTMEPAYYGGTHFGHPFSNVLQ